ncbi:MAG: helix-turn-helix transcriptional regulator [Candidatus Accumulibacter sp.]|jgi:putative transcriptional regulator|nr:helix-turn-helix transcriptional regulator [Accumulibacter sp.]
MDANPIKKIRKQLGLTQALFAEELNCSQGNISHYEAERRLVPPSMAKKIIDFAKHRGFDLGFDDIYLIDSPSQFSAAEDDS